MRPIVIAPYDPRWSTAFENARAELATVFDNTNIVVEHIGSTSVPGLAAKPIIDILLGAESLAAIERHIVDLSAIGYEYVPEFEDQFPDRRYFRRDTEGRRSHQIHAVVHGGEFWRNHICFRDALRRDSQLASAYEALKKDLAKQHQNDREGYTDAKTDFINGVTRKELKAMRHESQ